jgi:hypothetical protein
MPARKIRNHTMTDRPKFSFATTLAPKANAEPVEVKATKLTREQIREAWKRQTDKINARRA